MEEKTISFGPIRSSASFQWVGIDIAESLRKDYKVSYFTKTEVPNTDIIIFIKAVPKAHIYCNIPQKSKIVFCPIDYYTSKRAVMLSLYFLKKCNLIISHSFPLINFLQNMVSTPIVFCEHYGKYFLPQINPYKNSGYALWIGEISHLKHLINYQEKYKIILPVKVLTNYKKIIKNDNFTAYPWSEENQKCMMEECRVALDIKGEDFQQKMKPPTKAQQFICSGIPLAINNGHPATDYFLQQKLIIPTPDNDFWLSREYYENISIVANRLRPHLSLESVSQHFITILKGLLP